MSIIDILEDPENKYRPLNYWGWLENIAPEEVGWQIEEMSRVGLGGYVIHARGGLEIPYMGGQWLDSVTAAVKKGKELGMLTVVDDEDGWPSGFGAGEVNGKGEYYWLKWLEFERVKVGNLNKSDRTLGIYIINNNQILRLEDTFETENSDLEVLHIYYKTNKYYVDNLNPDVVREFIKSSYEKYNSKFGREFGSGIWGIFSDEPQLSRQYIPWSGIIPSEFDKRYGYDILEVLPALFYPVVNHEKVRYDFWNVVNKMFVDSYSKQVGEWCNRHNIIFMGHTAHEEKLRTQLLSSGGTMPFYEYMQIPGIDWLYRSVGCNVIVKQVSSVSQQLGKKRVLSEMFGCVGWNVSFEELKWIGEWHYVLGINLMLQHLGLYSLKGSRKREYPASLFYQQPWWDEFKGLNDYFARLSEIMTESEPQIGILVLHPIKSAWIAFEGLDYEKIGWDDKWKIETQFINNENDCFKQVKELDNDFEYLTDNLLELNYDFHYGDEEIMSRHGSIENGKLRIGEHSYSVVIIPTSISIDKNTLKLLNEYAANGGKIISAGDFPRLVEGTCTGEAESLVQYVKSVRNEKEALREALSSILTPPVFVDLCSGEENKDIYCCTRKNGDEFIYYIVNTNNQKSYDINIKIEKKEPVFKLNLMDCTMELLKSLEKVHLEQAESMLLLQTKTNTQHCRPTIQCEKTVSSIQISTDEEWDIQKYDLNSITLDYCSYSIDGGEWKQELSAVILQKKMLALGKPADVKMLFRFFAEDKIEASMFLVLEELEKYSISLNGQGVSNSDCGWWVDKSFRKIDLKGKISKGWNEIILERYFYCDDKVYKTINGEGMHEAESNRLKYDTELESIYLLGDFKVNIDGCINYSENRTVMVDGSFKLSPMTKKVKINNLVSEGFPFFAGKLSLTKKVNTEKLGEREKLILSFYKPDSIVTKISVNGKLVKSCMWAPYSIDISDYVTGGENEITIELINSLRNLLGPHHHKLGEIYAVGPSSFTGESAWGESEFGYEINLGENIWTDRYCFVRFGIEGTVKLTVISD